MLCGQILKRIPSLKGNLKATLYTFILLRNPSNATCVDYVFLGKEDWTGICTFIVDVVINKADKIVKKTHIKSKASIKTTHGVVLTIF